MVAKRGVFQVLLPLNGFNWEPCGIFLYKLAIPFDTGFVQEFLIQDMRLPNHHSLSGGRRIAALAGLVTWAAVALAPAADLSQMATRQVKMQADSMVNMGHYEQAIPVLRELISRLRHMTDESGISEYESALYSLGFCQMVTGQPEEAVSTLELYLKTFPDRNISRSVRARDMLAEASLTVGAYDRAIELYHEHIESRHTPEDRKRVARGQLVDAYSQAEKWREAIPVLSRFVDQRRDAELRGKAATVLCQAYVEVGEPEKVFGLVGIMERQNSPARYSLPFNLAMLAAGDQLLQSEQFELALPLYQIVMPKRLIEEWLVDHALELRERSQQLAATRTLEAARQRVFLNQQVLRLEQQSAAFEEIESYDEELRTRLAQAFFQTGRKWEAYWVYRQLMEDFPDSEHGEQAAFAAFALAAELGMR